MVVRTPVSGPAWVWLQLKSSPWEGIPLLAATRRRTRPTRWRPRPIRSQVTRATRSPGLSPREPRPRGALSNTRARAQRGSRVPVQGPSRAMNPVRSTPAGGVISTAA